MESQMNNQKEDKSRSVQNYLFQQKAYNQIGTSSLKKTRGRKNFFSPRDLASFIPKEWIQNP